MLLSVGPQTDTDSIISPAGTDNNLYESSVEQPWPVCTTTK